MMPPSERGPEKKGPDIAALRSLVTRVARTLRNKVWHLPAYNGEPAYLWVVAKGLRDDHELGLRIGWTQEVGLRKIGLRARELERCLHLVTIDLRDLRAVDGYRGPGPRPEVYPLLVEAFFGPHASRAWYIETREQEAAGKADKTRVRHWRLFVDTRWEPLEEMREEARAELRSIGFRPALEEAV